MSGLARPGSTWVRITVTPLLPWDAWWEALEGSLPLNRSSITASHLVKTVELNDLPQISVLPMGLGDTATFTSRQLPTRRGMAEDPACGAGKDVEVVQFVALDNIWPLLAGDDQRIDGVKIDVQGMELSTLTGMRQILGRQHPALIVEFHHGVDRGAVLALFRSAGYSTHPWSISTSTEASELVSDESYLFTLGAQLTKP